jgi:putative transposase
MARAPRITIPAYPHHIIQRGNNRFATFQKQVEAMTGRRLVGEARGRPKKTATTVEKVL